MFVYLPGSLVVAALAMVLTSVESKITENKEKRGYDDLAPFKALIVKGQELYESINSKKYIDKIEETLTREDNRNIKDNDFPESPESYQFSRSNRNTMERKESNLDSSRKDKSMNYAYPKYNDQSSRSERSISIDQNHVYLPGKEKPNKSDQSGYSGLFQNARNERSTGPDQSDEDEKKEGKFLKYFSKIIEREDKSMKFDNPQNFAYNQYSKRKRSVNHSEESEEFYRKDKKSMKYNDSQSFGTYQQFRNKRNALFSNQGMAVNEEDGKNMKYYYPENSGSYKNTRYKRNAVQLNEAEEISRQNGKGMIYIYPMKLESYQYSKKRRSAMPQDESYAENKKEEKSSKYSYGLNLGSYQNSKNKRSAVPIEGSNVINEGGEQRMKYFYSSLMKKENSELQDKN